MRTKETMLVLGCTGAIGGRVAERLWDGGHRIRAGSRQADPVFDWSDPAGWPAVVTGVTAMYVTLPAAGIGENAAAKLAGFLDAASRSGVRRVVFRSRFGERRRRAIERVVIAAGIDWTIVRTPHRVRLFTEPFRTHPVARGELALAAGGAAHPAIDADDVAEVVVGLLTSDGHAGRIYDLGGTRPLTYEEAVLPMARATGREI